MATGGRLDGEGADRPSVNDLSYAEAGIELDQIIEEFETGVVDVDRLVGRLERATDIVDELDRRLRRTRLQVEELVPRLEAIGRRDAAGSDSAAEDDDVPGFGDDESDEDVAGPNLGVEPKARPGAQGEPGGLF